MFALYHRCGLQDIATCSRSRAIKKEMGRWQSAAELEHLVEADGGRLGRVLDQALRDVDDPLRIGLRGRWRSGSGCLSRIDLSTGEVKLLAEGLALGAETLEGTPPTGVFNGVAVGPSGAIYITGDIAGVLYRFKSSN